MVVLSGKNKAYSFLNSGSTADMSKIATDLNASQARSASSVTGGSRRRPNHVGIIGAGVAGLRCAEVLLKHGVKVTMLEARGRLGGRVCSIVRDDEMKLFIDI
jgi:NADPH-dependent glutamate synthase beta subunit-like oxidoreductase